MSESYDPNQIPDVPEEMDPAALVAMEEESPRRAASAEFIVTSEVGSATALRDAMDPANQSLAEALRLSFRVLQLVILILIVLFLGSGFITVPDKFSGVLTRWGKIVPFQGSEALDNGLKYSIWPYPVSEFVLFEVENRTVDIKETFLPNSKVRGLTIAQHVEQIRDTDKYRDGIDGLLLTATGDISHVALNVVYEIEDPVKYISNVPIDQADDIVRLAAERACINAVSTTSLQDLLEISEDVRERIQVNAQAALNEIDCGIRIKQVSMPEPTRPPYQVLNTFDALQEAGVQGEQQIQEALNASEEIHGTAAGSDWRTILGYIEDYEDALELNDEVATETLLASINDWLDNKAGGEASTIISHARGYQSLIDSTLGNEAKRFVSLLPTFRDHPELVIRQRWHEATSNVLLSRTAETFFVPGLLGRMNLGISGLDQVAQDRRTLKLQRLNSAGWQEGVDFFNPNVLQAEDWNLGGPGRRLENVDGSVMGQGAAKNNP